jgi:glutaredoxin
MADQTNDGGRGKAAERALGRVADRLAPLRAAGWRALGSRDGAVVSAIRKVNDALGRPLAPADELADRRAFARGYRAEGTTPPATPVAAAAAGPSVAEPAPVLVYFLDKQRRDVPRLTEILDSHGVPYKLASLEEDPAAQAAIRRDSNGHRLPLVFIAGECVGGREQLLNLGNTGQLKKLVFG